MNICNLLREFETIVIRLLVQAKTPRYHKLNGGKFVHMLRCLSNELHLVFGKKEKISVFPEADVRLIG
jgi:hypothetical protein